MRCAKQLRYIKFFISFILIYIVYNFLDEHLEEVYQDELYKVLEHTDKRQDTISLHGWSNISSFPVIGVAVIVPNFPPIFKQAIDTQGEIY